MNTIKTQEELEQEIKSYTGKSMSNKDVEGYAKRVFIEQANHLTETNNETNIELTDEVLDKYIDMKSQIGLAEYLPTDTVRFLRRVDSLLNQMETYYISHLIMIKSTENSTNKITQRYKKEWIDKAIRDMNQMESDFKTKFTWIKINQHLLDLGQQYREKYNNHKNAGAPSKNSPIQQIDCITGEIVATYNSRAELMEALPIKKARLSIILSANKPNISQLNWTRWYDKNSEDKRNYYFTEGK